MPIFGRVGTNRHGKVRHLTFICATVNTRTLYHDSSQDTALRSSTHYVQMTFHAEPRGRSPSVAQLVLWRMGADSSTTPRVVAFWEVFSFVSSTFSLLNFTKCSERHLADRAPNNIPADDENEGDFDPLATGTDSKARRSDDGYHTEDHYGHHDQYNDDPCVPPFLAASQLGRLGPH
jgi:hypothetical protein